MVAVVQALNLSKVYHLGDERVYALNDVSLEVYSGELVAIVGTEGSGKSTLLHTLASLRKPDSGTVRIEEFDLTQMDYEALAQIRAHKIGFLFQAFNLLPNETAQANVEVSLPPLGWGDRVRRQRAEKALQFVGLEDHLKSRPGQLSAGQRISVAIARETVHNPAVLFADEATMGLDSTSRESVMGLFQKLNDDGMTIIIATPDTEVGHYCRRVVEMAEGRIVDDGVVPRRRIIRPSREPGPPGGSQVREEEVVCARCNYGSSIGAEICWRCKFPLNLTTEEEQSIAGRLSGAESRWLRVESASDEGQIPGQDMIEELKEVPFFTELGSKSLVKIIPALERQVFAKGSTIVKQGDVGDSFYIIRSGTVEVLLEREGKPVIPIAQLGPKDGFGEMALLTNQPRSANVVAATDVEVWRLAKVGFDELLSENLSLSLYFNRILTHRLRALQEKIIP